MSRNLLLVLAVCLLLICPAAAALYTQEMNEWIDTGGSMKGYTWGASQSQYVYMNQIRFSDITKYHTLNYIGIDISDNYYRNNNLPDGTNPFTYNLNGMDRDGVVYVSHSRDYFGSITSSQYILFFYDWDIGNLKGSVTVPLSPGLFKVEPCYYADTETFETDQGIRLRSSSSSNPLQISSDTTRYSISVSSGITWSNQITISEYGISISSLYPSKENMGALRIPQH